MRTQGSLPLLAGAGNALLVAFNGMGVAVAWAITSAWLLPVVESRLRRQLLESVATELPTETLTSASTAKRRRVHVFRVHPGSGLRGQEDRHRPHRPPPFVESA